MRAERRRGRGRAPAPKEEAALEGRRDAPEAGSGSPSPVTSAAPTRTGAEKFVSSREIGELADPPPLLTSEVAERSRTNVVARPITEFERRVAAGRPEPRLRSSPPGLVVATASDDGAPSDGAPSVKVRRRGVACTGTAEVVATTGTAGGDVPLRAELGSDMPNQLRSAKGTDCGGVGVGLGLGG